MFDVIVIGAGVVGPCIATAMARQGRKVMIVERDWSKNERIVGELLQPGGVKALQDLGMVEAINDIEAIPCLGYYIKYHKEHLIIEYPTKDEAYKTNPRTPVPGTIYDGNDKLHDDSTLSVKEWETDPRVRGVGCRNDELLQNLRLIVKKEPNVTWVQGTVTELIKEEEAIFGVKVKEAKGEKEYLAKLTVCCDGIYSKFRKLLNPNPPSVSSYFVGFKLIDCDLPAKYHGHVILGKHAPILIYQISKTETRILCAYRSTKPPSQSNNEWTDYLHNEVFPALPEPIKPSFKAAVKLGKFKAMPNQYLPAKKMDKLQGIVFLGDSLNMRHPLTGGGMTVGISDTVILARLLNPKSVPDLSNRKIVSQKLSQFHLKRKNLDAVINTLSIALYQLFAAETRPLLILQNGCFQYFQLGGANVAGPIGLLSGMLPFPMILFNHFFSVAFYAIYLNFIDHGLTGFLFALYEAFATIQTAVVVFAPYLWKELAQ